MPLGFLLASAAWMGPAWATPAPAAEPPTARSYVADDVVATHCATRTDLVGANCSYSTGLMARRVVDQGAPWRGQSGLVPTQDKLESGVAAPFLVGPDDGFRVIANEVVQVLCDGGHAQEQLELTGRWLEVDGVRYVVLTSFKVVNG